MDWTKFWKKVIFWIVWIVLCPFIWFYFVLSDIANGRRHHPISDILMSGLLDDMKKKFLRD